MRRYEGAWHMEQRPLFPEYIFLESGDGQRLAEELRNYPELDLLLGDANHLQPVEQEDERFLDILCGKEHHLSMSRGTISKGVTRITEGPLRGMEHRIRKIDRHKRLARIAVSMDREGNCIPAGLEIVEKD